MMSLHDSAINAPAEIALWEINATVFASLRSDINSDISIAASSRPPKVSISKMIRPAFLSFALSTRR